jgi:hypothetical protein
MRFALFASAKFAGRWGQGFAIIIVIDIVAIVSVGLCVVHQVGQWVGKAFVVKGVISSPKGFGRVGVRRGLVGRISGVLVGVLTVTVPQKTMPP